MELDINWTELASGLDNGVIWVQDHVGVLFDFVVYAFLIVTSLLFVYWLFSE